MLPDKLDSALAAIVTPVATDFNVYTSKSSDEKALPCVICFSEVQGEEDPKDTGNYMVRCTVAIKQSAVQNEDGADAGATGPKTSAQAATASILAAIMVDDLAAQLTAAGTDLTVFDGSIMFGAAESGRDETGIWVDSLTFQCYACGSSLS